MLLVAVGRESVKELCGGRVLGSSGVAVAPA
jgi:hypothetical protein